MAQINQSLFGATALSNGLLGTSASTLAVAPRVATPPVGRAYERATGEVVNSTIELRTPGTTSEVSHQWHLRMMGDIGKIWQDFTGKGVTVGVYDSGVQQAHWDLAANYDASKHVVVDGVTLDGNPVADPNDPDAPHGTSVAGLIAAARNERGGVGVAYGAKVTGVNIFDPSSPIYVGGTNEAAFIQALQQFNKYDVTNNSYGPAWDYFFGKINKSLDRGIEGSPTDLFVDLVAGAAATGRGGLGTSTVFAAGNDGLDGQFNSLTTGRHTITVGAFRELESARSSYSNFGPHILVSAPSNDLAVLGGTGQVTADLLGNPGYNWSADPAAPNDYTDRFGGTSGAAPIVAGVISLMLDANENLGWRDVRGILAASAKMPVAFDTGPVSIKYDSPLGPQPYELNMTHFRLTGQDANWNGGRMHHSNDYGYGAVDAYTAVRMAEVWSLFGPAKTSANEIVSTVARDVGLTSVGSNMTIDESPSYEMYDDFNGTPIEFKFTVSDNVKVEHVDLQIDFTKILNQFGTDYFTGLFFDQFKLIAPDGSEAFTTQYGFALGILGSDPTESMTFGFAGLQGVESAGTWTLQWNAQNAFLVSDAGVINTLRNSLTINSLKMDVYGSAVTNDDVYSYTNEFFTMTDIAGEAGRKQLNDIDGGTDWINAAAVSSNVNLSLVGGQSTSFGGQTAFAIGRTAVIENAVTGDGNDTLFGNRFDNKLYGMRGDDTLNGGAGNDTLFGGTGNDRFLFDNRGTSGKDIVLDWMRGDLIGTQTALRGVGSDGRVTVAANATLLLDGTALGDTVLLNENGGAVLQQAGQKDGYFWYSYVSGTTLNAGDVIREAGYQPERTAAGAVEAIVAATDTFGGSSDVASFDGSAFTLAGPAADQGAFYLYDPMAGSMSSGVLLHA